MENRQILLSDPNYEHKLKEDVSNLKIKLANCEDLRKEKEVKQLIRGKELGLVLETGEKPELYKELIEIQTEIEFYVRKYEKLKDLNNKTAQSFKDITDKTLEFEKKYEKIKYKEQRTLLSPNSSAKTEVLMKSKKFQDSIIGNYDSKIRIYSIKIKKLEEELNKLLNTQSQLSSLIEKKTDESKTHLSSLNDLKVRASSKFYKKTLNLGTFSDDLLFVTERLL